jgi:RNA polymerase sigma factor (sigma-70 family)
MTCWWAEHRAGRRPYLSKSDQEGRFNALLATHGPSLARLAGSYARDPTEREDLFQEIAIAVWRALPRFRGECSERTFLFRIAHNWPRISLRATVR